MLDALVHAYFETECITGPQDVHALLLGKFGGPSSDNHGVLKKVQCALNKLCARAASMHGPLSLPVLPRGGGRNRKLQEAHRPYLKRLAQMFDQCLAGTAVVDKCVTSDGRPVISQRPEHEGAPC